MEKLNFGLIKHSLYNYIVESTDISKSDVKKKVNEFSKIIKESEILSVVFEIYNNIENKSIKDEQVITRYLDKNLSLLEGISYKELIEESNKIKHLYSKTHIPLKKFKLYENINNIIIESTKKIPDVDIMHDSFEYIVNHIKTNETVVLENDNTNDLVSNDIIINLAIKKFNEKYKNLNESQRHILKTYMYGNVEEKISLFESTKLEAINYLTTEKDKNDIEVNENIDRTLKVINEMAYTDENFIKNIVKLKDLLVQ